MRAAQEEQSNRGPARPAVVIVAAIAGWAAALAYGAGYSGSRVAQVTPALAAEVSQPASRPAGFADVVEKVKPAVFGIKVKIEQGDGAITPESFGDGSLPRMGTNPKHVPGNGGSKGLPAETAQGAGFFISPDGYGVTSNHVVERSSRAEITTDDGATYTAHLVGSDAQSDLAVIKVDGRADFPYVRLSDRQPRIGDWVLAIGSPYGLSGTVTAGIVSARGRDIGSSSYDEFVQIDAPVNQGNSGGPAFDIDGNVIGVNTAIYSPTGGSVGIAFAVPADIAKEVVPQLKEKGTVTRGWAGLQIQSMTPDLAESLGLAQPHGALVAETIPSGPAAKAGIAAGDVITSVNAMPLKDSRALFRAVAEAAPGSQMTFGLLHDGKERSVEITLGELPSAKARKAAELPPSAETPPDLGLTLAPASQVRGVGGRGVVVIDAKRRGSGDQAIAPGDVILEISGKPVNSAGDVRSAVTNARRGGKRSVMMHVQSAGASRFVSVPVA
ncbi:MAG: trypsin-like peptidase domain-containing protein [Hyphomicrobiales bacterium]|nr:trypsin-like peptidase domain-containing protein [Hyphomicrobiales bacterium]MBV8825806.1 trypsin-like peptidase domain-containing protein [Hyphomicrobiales bacterium]MBV9428262.1 trypsin-like peptidase domain-containing protein [Bradyrhizobiaceae bacterium]